jgi:hypothetical protein
MEWSKAQDQGRAPVPPAGAPPGSEAASGDRRSRSRGRFEKALGVFQARMGDARGDDRPELGNGQDPN